MSVLAAERGFSFADPYAIALAFAGLAVFAAVGALSHQRERAFSASLIYLGLGIGAAFIIDLLQVGWIDPFDDALVIGRLAEFAVIVALFGTGLKLDRALAPRAWGSVVRLLGVVMPLTIAAVAIFGTTVMGLSLGAAIVLGAVLAPTDPVLAGDVGVGPPGQEEDESEPSFALTAEAGLNDGLAFPFVFLGIFVLAEGGTGWALEWLVADGLYAVLAGIAIGAGGGYLIAASMVRLRAARLMAPALDGWVAIGAVLLVYGLAEVAGTYGFLAAFAAGVAFRRYEREHEMNRRVHDGAEVVEKFCELALILLLGSLVTVSGIGLPGAGLLLVPLLLLVIRPLATMIAFAGSRTAWRERLFVGWFGVRGIGSLYYVAIALGSGILSGGEQRTLFWTVLACVVASIVVHGVTAAPLTRRLLLSTRS